MHRILLPSTCLVWVLHGFAHGQTHTEYAYDDQNRLVGVVRTEFEPEPVVVSISDATTTEGGMLQFQVSQTGDLTEAVVVGFSTSNGTAVGGSDYTSLSTSLTFSPSGASTQMVAVSSLHDLIYEGPESLYATISVVSGDASLGVEQAVGDINDDEPTPTVTIGDGLATEGNSANVTVSLTQASASSYNVSYSTANDTASAGSDYTSKSGTLTFSPGQTSKTISIATTENTTHELQERFRINLTSVTGGVTVEDGVSYVTITDDDAPPRFSINNRTVSEGQSATFTVTKTGATSLTHSLNYKTVNNSAIAGSDYSARSGTLSFSAGQTSKTITVPTLSDTTNEGQERFFVDLWSATNGATFSDSRGQGNINNVFYNTPPVAQNTSRSLSLGNGVTIQASQVATDADGHALTFSSVTQPTTATVTNNGSSLTVYATSPGTGVFSFTVSDGHGGTANGSVTVTVSGSSGGRG